MNLQRGTVKVDTARKRGDIKIVWLAWFTDSVALWKRQNEKPYLLDDPPIAMGSSIPTVDNQQQSSDYIDSEDDREPPETKETGRLELAAINWDDINDEVEAAMLESDDEDDMKSERSGMQSENVSEDEMGSENGYVCLIDVNLPSARLTEGHV
jgi:RNA polymerase II subunit A-like phosphatase